jgi:hypothetical protein
MNIFKIKKLKKEDLVRKNNSYSFLNIYIYMQIKVISNINIIHAS